MLLKIITDLNSELDAFAEGNLVHLVTIKLNRISKKKNVSEGIVYFFPQVFWIKGLLDYLIMKGDYFPWCATDIRYHLDKVLVWKVARLPLSSLWLTNFNFIATCSKKYFTYLQFQDSLSKTWIIWWRNNVTRFSKNTSTAINYPF